MPRQTSLKGFLPQNAFVMAKRAVLRAPLPEAELSSIVDASLVEPALQSTLQSTLQSAPKKADLVFFELAQTLTGASSELLQKMIDAMGVAKSKVEITNLASSDLNTWPGKVVVALGEDVAQKLLKSTSELGALRAKVHFLKDQTKIIATYHPSFLLQNPQFKKDAWEDLKLAMRELSVNQA